MATSNQRPTDSTGMEHLDTKLSPGDFARDVKRLANDYQPGPMDVICARGKKAYRHRGNQRFRKLVEHYTPEYETASNKLKKTLIVSRIIEKVRHLSPSGGFVKEDETGRWLEVGDHAAREKVGQSFRDLLHGKYRSSTKAKKRRREVVQSTKTIAETTEPIQFLPFDCPTFDQIKDKISVTAMSNKEAKSLFYQANTELLRQIKEKEVFRIEDEDFPVIEPVSFEVAMSKPESCQDFVFLSECLDDKDDQTTPPPALVNQVSREMMF